MGDFNARFVFHLSLSILLLSLFSSPIVVGMWPPPSYFRWISATGSASTYGSGSAQGWLRFFASPDDGWVGGWCVFSVPPLRSYGFWFDPPPPFNFSLYVARVVNASIVELDSNGSDLLVRGFWEVNNMSNPSAPSLALENMTVKTGELSITGNWSSFTINIEGYESVQGDIASYFAGEVYGYFPCFDLDDNGIIDMRDIGMAARSFGSIFGFNIRYDFRADINLDFKIDMKDIGECARRFGTRPRMPAT